MISTEKMQLVLYTRQSGGTWVMSRATGADTVVELQSIGVQLRLADIYENVQFPANPRVHILPVDPSL
jgi:hypothetical protein